MQKFWLLLFILMPAVLVAQGSVIQLQGEWTLSSPDTSLILKTNEVHSVHEALWKAGMIADPYYGDNEKALQWIAEMDWIFTSEPFDVSFADPGVDKTTIRFECLDTYAQVWLNGALILESDNYFIPHEVDIQPLVRPAVNTLKIVIESPYRKGREQLLQQQHALPGEAIRAVTRKPQFHYGWDWGPKLTTSGIPGPITIHTYSQLQLLDTYEKHHFNDDGSVDVVMHLAYAVFRETRGTLRMNFGNQAVNEEIDWSNGAHEIELKIHLGKDVPRWWPHTHGDPALMSVSVEFEDVNGNIQVQYSGKSAIRQMVLRTDKDSIGESFTFEINGIPVFMKGANYIPLDLFTGQIHPGQYEEFLTTVKESNMNMLRVWGGGIYETEEFYSLCDSLGI
ncbi:MAG: hypothetical protein KDC12_12095, partial [Flavobacteriales bacterium]|nr:hypothetical protein [Flavobacteriales bacterium]